MVLRAEYYLGNVHALTESGEFIMVSNSGSQLCGILVIGTQKIVPDLTAGLKRMGVCTLT